ncbi:MAG: histidinol dehydrogenase [Bacteroidales bacterium]|nr:histidinol dehydrogenase [Bacteroidales bacterium]MCF8333660.1 histidinol dehydrogenase [Bacteroidales bacterium]
MQIIKYPDKNEWSGLLARPQIDQASLREQVKIILDDVKRNGDEALLRYTKILDGFEVDSFKVTGEEFKKAEEQVSDELKEAIKTASKNIEKFHRAQWPEDVVTETTPGIECRQKAVPINSVGLYIPGGTAPLFSSVLMMAIPARIAGCKDIVMCTPPKEDGSVDPAILFAAKYAGVTKVFKVGGAQAIAAMSYGAESIPKVSKIFGPGNQYVTLAKQMVFLDGTAIDMPAGPSEVMVIADETTNPEFAAADLLSQAEHGPDSQVVLASTSEKQVEKTRDELLKRLEQIPRKRTARESLKKSRLIVLEEKDLPDIINYYAPEHLIIATENPESLAEKVENTGSVFLGSFTPESLGDYASGTNHVLPTNGSAKVFSGVNLDSFMKKISFQKATQEGLNRIGRDVETMASAEQLEAHRLAVSVRTQNTDEK